MESIDNNIDKIKSLLFETLIGSMKILTKIGEIPSDVVPSFIEKSFLNTLHGLHKDITDHLLVIYIGKLIEKLFSKLKSRTEDMLLVKCILQNLLISKYVERFMIGDKSLILNVESDLDDTCYKLITFAYELISEYNLCDLSYLLYLFTDYDFAKPKENYLNSYFIAKRDSNNEKRKEAIQKLIIDAQNRCKSSTQYDVHMDALISLLMKVVDKFNEEIAPENTASNLKSLWGRLCECAMWAILLKHEVLFSFNAYLNPNIYDGKVHDKIGEFDGLIIPERDDELIFVDVTFSKNIDEKIRKCKKFFNAISNYVSASVWIVCSDYSEYKENLIQNLSIIPLSKLPSILGV
ncbi:MAG: hypothetical protein QXO01_05190 [Nitrososphaerota archaeon]